MRARSMVEQTRRSSELRRARAALKMRVRSLPMADGRQLLAEAIEEWPEYLHNCPLVDPSGVLRWPFRGQPQRFAAAIGAHPRKRLCELTDRQRALLVRALRGDLAGVEFEEWQAWGMAA